MNQAPVPLISGPLLKQAAQDYAAVMRAKITKEQKGFLSIFDKWFAHLFMNLMQLDPSLPWETSVLGEMKPLPADEGSLAWDFIRVRLFLDRWAQGRLVDFARRQLSGQHYGSRFGGEFDGDVFLTAQGAPKLMQWRGIPLMKTVFDFALYPLLLAELRPRTIFEVGSGLGASALWFADLQAISGVEAHVHSVDINPPVTTHRGLTFHSGDCSVPETLFPANLLATAPRPWLVIEDAHHNVEAVLHHFDQFLRHGDYLVVEDSEIKLVELQRFNNAHPDSYKVDTKYTDYFGRNATCAGDSIFVRV